MQFLIRRQRQPPTVIIVSLIDILIVLLIFLTATTTFKHHPAVQITLPDSRQAKEGSTENRVLVTISKEGLLFFGTVAVTFDQLVQELRGSIASQPDLGISVNTDAEAPAGQFLRVIELAKSLKFAEMQVLTKPATAEP